MHTLVKAEEQCSAPPLGLRGVHKRDAGVKALQGARHEGLCPGAPGLIHYLALQLADDHLRAVKECDKGSNLVDLGFGVEAAIMANHGYTDLSNCRGTGWCKDISKSNASI